MSDRIFRFGFTGVIYLLFVIFWYWELGGEHIDMLSVENDKIIVAVFAVVSLPGIGFFLSGCVKEIWEWCPGPRNFFRLPTNEIAQQYYAIILKEFPNNSGIIDQNGILLVADRDILFVNHEILIRKDDSHKEAILFTARRYDNIYSNLNIFYSVLFSLPIAFFLTNKEHWPPELHLSWWKLGWLPVLIAYMIFNMRRCILTIKEVNEFEHRLIINSYGK